MSSGLDGVIVALAGRRIDPASPSQPRFPPENIDRVRDELRQLFLRLHARALVCSAASGADLLALDAAGEVGLRRHVVLPFASGRFRQTSVVDRPGPWGSLFDEIVIRAEAQGDLVVLPGVQNEDESYAIANARLLNETEQVANGQEGRVGCAATVVWEGEPRPGQDLTAQFRSLARERGWPVYEVSTL